MSKTLVEDTLNLSIQWLQSHQYLIPGATTCGTLTWKQDGDPLGRIKFEARMSQTSGEFSITLPGRDCPTYWIDVVATRLPWGSLKFWFKCPMAHHNVANGVIFGKLYLPSGHETFGCRSCHQLTYWSRIHGPRNGRLLKLVERFRRQGVIP